LLDPGGAAWNELEKEITMDSDRTVNGTLRLEKSDKESPARLVGKIDDQEVEIVEFGKKRSQDDPNYIVVGASEYHEQQTGIRAAIGTLRLEKSDKDTPGRMVGKVFGEEVEIVRWFGKKPEDDGFYVVIGLAPWFRQRDEVEYYAQQAETRDDDWAWLDE